MTIRPLAPGALAANRASDMFVSMRRELDSLQRQLATGKKTDSFGGLGFERRSSLDVRGKMAMLSGYQTAIEGGTLRLKIMAQATERLDGIARETRSDLMGAGFILGSDRRTMPQRLAEQRMREALDHLNNDVNGRYLFAGRNVDAPPVETYERIMNGDAVAGQAGLKALISERTAAEVGVDGLGRVSTAVQPPVSTSGYTEFAFSPVTLDAAGDSIAFNITLGANPPVAVTIDKTRADAASVGNDGVLDTIGEFESALQASLAAAGVTGVTLTNDGTNIRITHSATTGINSTVDIDVPVVIDGGGLDTLATSGGVDTDTPVPGAAPSLQLTGNGASFPFGFEIVSASASSAMIVGSGAAAGSPEQVDLTVNGVPAHNDTVSVVLRDKAGATYTIQLTARTTVNPGERNVFAIGADENATMNGPNGLRAALETAIRDKATAVLKPRAAVLAAQEFFDGSASNAPDRVATAPPRLTVSNPVPTTARVTGDATTNLGFEILATSTDTGANINTAFTAATAGPPAMPEFVNFQLTGVPSDGDTVVLQLRDRTGAPHTVTLTARTAPTSNPNEFQIGADAATTVSGANGLNVALNRTLAAKAAEVLNIGEATAMDTSGARATLIWYKGDDATLPSARDTAKLRIDASQEVGTGARANEPAIRSFLAQLGVLADATFTDTPAEKERFETLTIRVRENLTPPNGQQRLEELATDFGAAMATLEGAKQRHQTAANMLQDTLDKVEQASVEETAAAMLNLQNRLQASYQTTSMLSRLSLVNFL
jgi:flagellar hook-associated protein 3 FlgL